MPMHPAELGATLIHATFLTLSNFALLSFLVGHHHPLLTSRHCEGAVAMAPRLPLRPLVFLLSFLLFVALFNFIPNRSSYFASSSTTLPGSSAAWSRLWGSSSSSSSSSSPPSFIPPKPNAALLILCRNEDLGELLPTLHALESTFNSHPLTSYPYVLLNDQAFTPHFKSKLTTHLQDSRQRFGGPHALPPDLRFGQIPKEHWSAPDWIDWDLAQRKWKVLDAIKVPYAMSESYRHMCRFQSGFFYRHELLKDMEFYWRVEPQTRYTCNLVPGQGGEPTAWDDKTDGTGDFFDPFRWMKVKGKKYGWVLSLKEYKSTIKTLWPKARKWLLEHPQFHSPNLSMLPFVLAEDKIGYNLCHFWSNFEIASLDFFRSEAYQSFFDFLDRDGMFFYERTGDAPVHTIAAAWLLGRDEVHQFSNIVSVDQATPLSLWAVLTTWPLCSRATTTHPSTTARSTPLLSHGALATRGRAFSTISPATVSADVADPRRIPQTDPFRQLLSSGCQKEYDVVQGVNSTEEILRYNKDRGWPDLSTFRILDIPHGQ